MSRTWLGDFVKVHGSWPDPTLANPSKDEIPRTNGLCIVSRDWWIMIPTEGVTGIVMPVALFTFQDDVCFLVSLGCQIVDRIA